MSVNNKINYDKNSNYWTWIVPFWRIREIFDTFID